MQRPTIYEIDDGLRKLLESYAEPCLGDCDHGQCPLLRELHALRIKATLGRARLTVKSLVDKERKGEEIGDLMSMRLHSAAPLAAPSIESNKADKASKAADQHLSFVAQDRPDDPD